MKNQSLTIRCLSLCFFIHIFHFASTQSERDSLIGYTCGTKEVSRMPSSFCEKNEEECIVCNDEQVKFLRINFHFMLGDQETFPRNFTETHNGTGDPSFTAYDYSELLLNALNHAMSNNAEANNLVPGTDNDPSYFPPKRIMFTLDGIYFHKDDNYNDYSESNSTMHNLYGVNPNTVYNIYLYGGASLQGESSGKVIYGTNAMALNKVRLWYLFHPDFTEGTTADVIFHELGHIWGLCHSFANANGCNMENAPSGDINTAANCGNPNVNTSCTGPNAGCNPWNNGDNNSMGYNPHGNNTTPCQLDIIHGLLESDHASYVAFCCDDWEFELRQPTINYPFLHHANIEMCEPSHCEIPEIEETITDCSGHCQVNYSLADPTTPLCAEWTLTVWDENAIESEVITSSTSEVEALIPNGYSYQVCLSICGKDCDTANTCWSKRTCNASTTGPQVQYQYVNENNVLVELVDGVAIYHPCEEVYINASASSLPAIHHYYTLFEVVNGQENFLAWTHEPDLDDGLPQAPTNITEVFQNYCLKDGDGDTIDPITLQPDVTYRLQFNVFYEVCGEQIRELSRQDFRIGGEIEADFHFEDEDGVENEVFVLPCDDIFFDASASTTPVTEHRYTLYRLNGNNEVFEFWTDFVDGSPTNPTNFSEFIEFGLANGLLLGGISGPILKDFEFQCDTRYVLQLELRCNGVEEIVKQEFTVKCDELCDPCLEPELDVFVISNANESSSCTFVVVNNNHTGCSNWIVNDAAIFGTMGSIEFISSNVEGDLNVCVTNCHPDCIEEQEPVCMTIPQEEIENCNFENVNDVSREVRLFPNPANELITIESDKYILDRIVIYDTSGNIIQDQAVRGNQATRLNISQLRSGTYNLTVWTIDQKVAFKTFVKI